MKKLTLFGMSVVLTRCRPLIDKKMTQEFMQYLEVRFREEDIDLKNFIIENVLDSMIKFFEIQGFKTHAEIFKGGDFEIISRGILEKHPRIMCQFCGPVKYPYETICPYRKD